jgi:hypothetical protein
MIPHDPVAAAEGLPEDLVLAEEPASGGTPAIAIAPIRNVQ